MLKASDGTSQLVDLKLHLGENYPQTVQVQSCQMKRTKCKVVVGRKLILYSTCNWFSFSLLGLSPFARIMFELCNHWIRESPKSEAKFYVDTAMLEVAMFSVVAQNLTFYHYIWPPVEECNLNWNQNFLSKSKGENKFSLLRASASVLVFLCPCVLVCMCVCVHAGVPVCLCACVCA